MISSIDLYYNHGVPEPLRYELHRDINTNALKIIYFLLIYLSLFHSLSYFNK
jgi:hypothetical protein